jgi:adenylosuccinate lyase
MHDLELDIEYAATQIVNRDRHIEFISVICNIATSVEKLASEIRNLQRTELTEVAEAFDVKKQVGSSTMAHKRNPIISENISGLARVIRGFILPTFENALQWHERDLANSSSERFIIPHSCILLDDILIKLSDLISNLQVFPENMMRNIERVGGEIMAESVMQALVKNGLARDDSYKIVRNASVKSRESGKSYKEILLNDKIVMATLEDKELEFALNPKNYIGSSKKIVSIVYDLVKKSKLIKSRL